MINCNLLKEHLLFSLTGSLYCIDWNGCESVCVSASFWYTYIYKKQWSNVYFKATKNRLLDKS